VLRQSFPAHNSLITIMLAAHTVIWYQMMGKKNYHQGKKITFCTNVNIIFTTNNNDNKDSNTQEADVQQTRTANTVYNELQLNTKYLRSINFQSVPHFDNTRFYHHIANEKVKWNGSGQGILQVTLLPSTFNSCSWQHDPEFQDIMGSSTKDVCSGKWRVTKHGCREHWGFLGGFPLNLVVFVCILGFNDSPLFTSG